MLNRFTLPALFLQTVLACFANADDDKAWLEQVDAVVQPYVDAGWFSGTVAIFSEDALVYERSEGLADRERDVANTLDTRLRIGSINKHYTAALVLRLAQQGRFDLDDTIGMFDLGFPDAIASRVTLRHLLSHRSGFEDLFTEEYRRSYQSLKTISDKLPLLMHRPLRFEPGSDQYYSNYGYIVLGAVIEKVTEKTFGEVLSAEILEPINATDTRYALTDNVKDKALSYTFTHMGRKLDVTERLENPTPDGGMYATARDLVAFYSALFYSDLLINNSMKALMMSGYQHPERDWSDIVSDPTSIRVGYGGGPGVSAAVELHLADRLFVVVLANTDAVVAERISQRITAVFKGEGAAPMQLPVAVFTYRFLDENGTDALLTGLPDALATAGYDDFSDRWLNRLGFELYDLGKLDEALAVLTVNSALFPDAANPYDSLGYIHEALGDPASALASYRKALSVDPEFPSALEAVERLSAPGQPSEK